MSTPKQRLARIRNFDKRRLLGIRATAHSVRLIMYEQFACAGFNNVLQYSTLQKLEALQELVDEVLADYSTINKSLGLKK